MRNLRAMAFAVAAVGATTTSALAQGSATNSPIKIDGTLELNYTYNFNKPAFDNALLGPVAAGNNRNGYYFNRRESQFMLNLAEVHLSKDPTDTEAGFSIRLVDGEVVKGLLDGTTTNIWEAYGSIQKTFHGKKLKIDAGLLPTHIGYETIEVGTNNFLSKSFHFGQFQPFYVSGVRAAWSMDEKTTVTGYVQNRFNGVARAAGSNNRDLGVGVQVSRMLGGGGMLNLNGLVSRDSALNDNEHDIINAVYTAPVGETFTVAVDASYGRYKSAVTGKHKNVSAVTGYVTHKMGNGNVIAVRGEYLTDNGAPLGFTDDTTIPTTGGETGTSENDAISRQITGLTQTALLPSTVAGKRPTLSSISVSYEFHGIAANARTLVEYRADVANTAIFSGKSSAKKNQSTITLSQIFTF